MAAAGNLCEALIRKLHLTAAAGLDRDKALHKVWNLTVTCREGFSIKSLRALCLYAGLNYRFNLISQRQGGLDLQ